MHMREQKAALEEEADKEDVGLPGKKPTTKPKAVPAAKRTKKQ